MGSAAQFSGAAVTPHLAIRRNNVHTRPRQTSIKVPGRMKLLTVGAITVTVQAHDSRKRHDQPSPQGEAAFELQMKSGQSFRTRNVVVATGLTPNEASHGSGRWCSRPTGAVAVDVPAPARASDSNRARSVSMPR